MVDTFSQFIGNTMFIDPFVFKEEDGCVSLDDLLSYLKFLPASKVKKFKFLICVPTPSTDEGECDDSIARSVIDQILKAQPLAQILIKSTISLESAKHYEEDLNTYANLTFSPEFLRGRHAVSDSLDEDKMIVGAMPGSRSAESWIDHFAAAYSERVKTEEKFQPYKHVRTSFLEALIAKYAENMFLAMRVTFFNELRNLAVKEGANYSGVVQALSLDPRIGDSHSQVPGPDGEYGWGGHCLPKDTSALISRMKKIGMEPKFFSTICEVNEQHRENKGRIDDRYVDLRDRPSGQDRPVTWGPREVLEKTRPPHALEQVDPSKIDVNPPHNPPQVEQSTWPKQEQGVTVHGYALDNIYDDDGNLVGAGGQSN